MPYTVIADGLTKRLGDHRVLDGVDLAIEAGSVFALLGPNGAG
jgi:ABC-2 type transport system ATP-binding protein